jgi:hypothetical protein
LLGVAELVKHGVAFAVFMVVVENPAVLASFRDLDDRESEE